MNIRRVVTKNQTGYISVIKEPTPPVRPGTMLVKVHASLISTGTELSRLRGKERSPEGSFRHFGYQCAGEVIQVGDGCRGYQPGQRVACMGGDARHTDYAVVPQNLVTPLPDSMSYEEGAFVALAATAMHALRRGEIVFGEEVVVMGLGVLGQLVAQGAVLAGTRVVAFDPLPLRVERARKAGVTHAYTDSGDRAVDRVKGVMEGYGADCAFLCAGEASNSVLPDVARMMKRSPDTHPYGRIVSVGGTLTHPMGASFGNLDLRSSARSGPGYHDPEYELGADYPPVFVRWTTQTHLRLFTRWVAEGRLNVKDLISTRVPIESADEACYALLDEHEQYLGVIITYT